MINKYMNYNNYVSYYRKKGGLQGISLRFINNILIKISTLKKLDKIIARKIKKLLKIEDNNGNGYLWRKIKELSYKKNYKNQPRKYIRPDLSIESFFKELNKRKVEYVILRWFENLPKWDSDEDIDILIRDEDIERILDLFNNKPKGIKTDVYTLKGTKGGGFGNAGSYYPPKIGERILKTKKLFKGTFYVPSEKEHFLSLLYHIVYHKSESSGLPLSENELPVYREADHDYTSVIRSFSYSKQLENNINLLSLHNFLQKKDFSPEIDTLRKLYIKQKSEFLLSAIQSETIQGIEPYDIIVFFVRDWAFENNKVIDIIDTIAENNLEILSYKYLDGDIKDRVAKKVRGGNWSKGPYPVDGGLPQLAVITLDYHPKQNKDISTHPFVTNSNVFIKGKIRDKINNEMLMTKWVNSIHSSDDFTEAKDYIDIIDANLYSNIERKLQKRLMLYNTDYKVITTLPSYNTRSKTEVIAYKDNKAVKKTYKYGKKRFLNREIYVYRELSRKNDAIPPLLKKGDSYYIIPYYENVLNTMNISEKKKVLLKYKKDILSFLKFFYEEGYAIIDFNPENIIITPSGEFKVIDFEFLYRYKNKPGKFIDSYDIKGIPKKFDGDLPKGTIAPGVNYKRVWKSILGKIED